MRRSAVVLSASILALGLLSACSDDAAGDGDADAAPTTSSPSASTSPTESPSTPTALVINATIRGDDIEPNGERFKASVGEEITLNIDADRAGELHVHSVPEQELEYAAGATTLTLTIDTPGVVDIEDHQADKVLVSIEVS